MPFLLLLVLAVTVTFLQSHSPEPPFGPKPWLSVVLTWGGVVGLGAVVDWLSRRYRRIINQNPSQRPLVMRRLSTWRRSLTYALLAFYGAALYVLGWGWLGKDYLFNQVGEFPGRALVLMSPFLAVLIFSWARYYDVERAGRDANLGDGDDLVLGRWTYVGLQARHNLLLVLPPLLLFLIQETVLVLFPALKNDVFFLPVFFACLVVAAVISIPWLLRLILGLRPLPDGVLRARLLDTARRLQFRCNDILLWNTRNSIANAMVTGPLPFLRYVVLTDRLIDELEPEEVEAVFGHEVGHIKHHHMLFYLAFVLASLFALEGIGNTADAFLQIDSVQAFLHERVPALLDWFLAWDYLAALPMVLLLAVYIVVVFGFLSRRCERQADIYGCRTASCQVFINALEKVALLNGIHRERPGWLSSWQHSTIARRVEFLQRMSADPALEASFQRRVGLVKWGVVLGLGAVVVGVVAVLMVLDPHKVWAMFR